MSATVESLTDRLMLILLDANGPASDATRLAGEDVPWEYQQDDFPAVYINGLIELPQFAAELLQFIEDAD